MNKKFSTLMTMGLLATGSLCSSAWAADAVEINGSSLKAITLESDANPSGSYIIVADANGNGVADNNEYALEVTANATTGLLEYKGHQLKATEDLEDLASLTWSFSEIPVTDPNGAKDGYLYSLYNAGVGAYLTTDANLNIRTNPKESSHDASKDQYARFSVQQSNQYASRFTQQSGLYLYKADNTTISNALEITASISAKASTASNLILCELSEKVLAGTELEVLNDVMGGEGFALTFKDDDKAFETNILKDQNLKAFYVPTAIPMGAGNVPAGIYLATEYPESLIGTDQITKKADFEACTFIAVDADKNYDIHKADRANAIGFDFTTVKGDAFNYYKGADKKELSEPGEIYVGNARFEIVVANPLAGYETYSLRLPEIRVAVKTTEHATKGGVYVGVIKDQNKNYLLTSSTAVSLSTTNSTLYAPTQLLTTDETPSVYTIQFVSGEKKEGASEFEQYLTSIFYQNGTQKGFTLASTVQFDANDPLYQFTVNGVDQKNRIVTLVNRQSKAKFSLSLYEEGDGVYTVFPAAKQNNKNAENTLYVETVSSDDEIATEKVNLAKTKIRLTKIDYATIDKFATFMNREEGAGVVKFRLAKNNVADAVFYAGAKRSGKDKEITTGSMKAWEDYVDEFELIKSKDSILIVTDFIYLYKDDEDNDKDVWRRSVDKDTVAYYTYKVKLFDDTKQYYLNESLSLVNKESNAADFIIKENIDGSHALILKGRNGSLTESEMKFAKVNATDDGKDAWTLAVYYDFAANTNAGLKTFIEEETAGISLEAVAQHVSMQATEGGFVSAKDGEGKIAIATEVSDDLKFWVEPQDDKANIPSFYIANAGRYMYYALDSAKVNKDLYTFGSGDTKLIFKAAELIDADTLKTTVDKKSVYVAAKGNPSKNVKGGLNNFLYQIVKFEEGSDEYVIRSVANPSNYVRNINGQLTLAKGRKDALKVTIESQSAPTANEEIATSEVTVIAGEGQLTIANAAGKKVVVSNILGQVVANTVLSSDNATIAAPQGVVVVAVEGEEAVKAIVK